ATLLSEKLSDVFTPGDHGSTFGGNPVCCAGAISIINRIDDALLAEINAKSEYIISELTASKGVEAVDGMGLMLGVTTKRPVDDVVRECMEEGVLPIKAKQKLRLLPALNISWDELKEAVKIIKNVCER
ncbi:MAG: aminotransferase class III-fold pyridoxal phosphate-dependent enzyme, partial [Oscillospiraceae bacterium]|nr:aminotransferase class III-fold pyridoxal phosphate-dependent enzyme [Oscillospiraceae bacterium]